MSAPTYNWQRRGWPRFTYNRAHLSDELSAFADAFRKVKAAEGKVEHRGSKKTGGYYILEGAV